MMRWLVYRPSWGRPLNTPICPTLRLLTRSPTRFPALRRMLEHYIAFYQSGRWFRIVLRENSSSPYNLTSKSN